MKKITICAALNKHSNEIYNYLNNYNQIPKCLECIKQILKSEENNLKNPIDAQRCINTLTSSLNNNSKFLSTLTTWMTTIRV